MDQMREYEVDTLVDCIPYTDVNGWEQTRSLMWLIANVLSKEELKVTDVMSFKWDARCDSSEHITEISNDDIKRLREKAMKRQNEQKQ